MENIRRQVWIWLRSWEDTLTAAGYSRDEAHRWIDARLRHWGI